jgi:hypothetical protein
MAEYRAYILGEDGHIRSYRAFVCEGDADAMVCARQLVDGNDVELWSGGRFVIRFNHVVVRAVSIGGYLPCTPSRGQIAEAPDCPVPDSQRTN